MMSGIKRYVINVRRNLKDERRYQAGSLVSANWLIQAQEDRLHANVYVRHRPGAGNHPLPS